MPFVFRLLHCLFLEVTDASCLVAEGAQETGEEGIAFLNSLQIQVSFRRC